mgnify:CR=1 FL=1
MANDNFGTPEFHEAAARAGRKAFEETLAAGFPVFYRDEQDRYVMEKPDGSRFEIRWIPGAPSGKNYEIVRELSVRAA